MAFARKATMVSRALMKSIAALTLAVLGFVVSPVAQDDPVVLGLGVFLKADTEADKVAALDSLFELLERHDAAAVTDALGHGLRDESAAVRIHAIGLVTRSPARDAALTALVAGCQVLDRRGKALGKAGLEAAARVLKARNRPKDRRGSKAAADEIQADLDTMAAITDTLKGEAEVLERYVVALGEFDDDRTIGCYELLLTIVGAHDRGMRIAKALFTRNHRKGLEVAITPLQRCEKQVRELRSWVKKIKRTRPRPEPKGWRGTKSAWVESEKLANGMRWIEALKMLDEAEAVARTYADCLRDLARERGLPQPPKNERYSSWRYWVSRAAKALEK